MVDTTTRDWKAWRERERTRTQPNREEEEQNYSLLVRLRERMAEIDAQIKSLERMNFCSYCGRAETDPRCRC